MSAPAHDETVHHDPVEDITKQRAEGNRKRRAEIANMRQQADAVVARLERIRNTDKRAS